MYCNNSQYKKFLEIGTWNGIGSTKCFVDIFPELLNNERPSHSYNSIK